MAVYVITVAFIICTQFVLHTSERRDYLNKNRSIQTFLNRETNLAL